MLRYPSKRKDKLLHLAPPTAKKEAQGIAASLDFGSNIVLILVCYCGTFTECPKKLLALSGAQHMRRLCNWTKLLCKLLCHLSHVIQQFQWSLKCQWQIGVL